MSSLLSQFRAVSRIVRSCHQRYDGNAWTIDVLSTGWHPDIADACHLCVACPKDFRGSADFGFYTGWCIGRLTQFDRMSGELPQEQEQELLEAQDAVYAVAERFTLFNPAVFCCAAAYIAPAAVFSLFGDEVWPEGLRHFRPFWMGWFLGQWQEGEQTAGSVMSMQGVPELVLGMIEQHRRSGEGPSVFDGIADLLTMHVPA